MKEVYAIQHSVTKRVYVGVTCNAEFRIKQHLHKLLRGKHSNKEMQRDFDKYGFRYSFYIIERHVENDVAFERERYWMNVLGSNRKDTGYNLSKCESPYEISKFEKIEISFSRGKLANKVCS